jgi:hypothetical protein
MVRPGVEMCVGKVIYVSCGWMTVAKERTLEYLLILGRNAARADVMGVVRWTSCEQRFIVSKFVR